MLSSIRNGISSKLRLLHQIVPKEKDTNVIFQFQKRQQHFETNVSKSLPAVGDSFRLEKVYTHEDMKSFAELCGDYNPIHLDDNYAKETRFGRCIVYGLLTNSLAITAAQKLIGSGAIFVSQKVKYTAPLYVGENFEAECKITDVKKSMISIEFQCKSMDEEKVLIKGNAIVYKAKDSSS